MPLYYFDVIDDGRSFSDECGIELEDQLEVRQQAQALLPHLARERLPIEDRRDLSVIVRGSEGQHCYKATLTIRGEWMDSLTTPSPE